MMFLFKLAANLEREIIKIKVLSRLCRHKLLF